MATSSPEPSTAALRRPASVPGQKKARHQRWTRIAGATTVVGLLAFVGLALWKIPGLTSKPSLQSSQEQGCTDYLDGIAKQVRDFLDKRGRLPETLADLRHPDLASTFDAEPWDCWNKPIEYRIVDAAKQTFRLRSTGPDLVPDTADDIHWPTDQPWK